MTRYDIYVKTSLEDRIIVSKKDKWGVIDKEENIIIPLEYDEIIKQYSGETLFFEVRIRSNYRYKCGIIDSDGKILLPVEYDGICKMLLCYKDGIYVIKKEGKCGVFDFSNSKLIDCQFDRIERYCSSPESFTAVKNNLIGVFNFSGEEIIPPEYNNIFKFESGYVCRKGKYYGVIDNSKKLVLDYIYTSIRISEKNVLLCERGNKGGLFKFNGEVILPCEYEFLESCGYGTHEYWRYSKYKKGKLGIIACNGKLVCDEKYDAVEYSQGNIVVWEKDKCTLLNENGQEQFPFIYEKIRKIFDDPELLAASLNGKFGIIKPNGDVVVACKYTDITEYIYGYAVVSEGYDKVGLVNMEGYEVIPTVYSNIEQIDSEYIVVTKNHKNGVLKTNGKQCLPIIYDDIYNISENSAEVKIADKKGTAYFVE